MINNVIVLSRGYLNDIINSKNKYDYWSLISIYSSPSEVFITDTVASKLLDLNCKYYLSLMFSDISKKTYIECIKNYEYKNNLYLFNKSHAEQIIEFVNLVNNKENQILVIHCDAGVSRSGAVGEFICDYLELDYNEFKRINKHILPNSYVLKVLRTEAGMSYDTEVNDG